MDARLTGMFESRIGAYSPRTSVRPCCFVDSKEFSFSWAGKGDCLEVRVSDYVMDAPDDVLEDVVDGILRYIYRRERSFGPAFREYMSSDAFILAKRPVYFRRSRNLTDTGIGKVRSLYDSVQRLMDAGLVRESDIDNSIFVWTTRPLYTRMGKCSTMMRIVSISSVFDSDRWSEHTLDYVVYHEIIHLRLGYRPFDRNPHDRQFRREMSLYPDSESAEEELRRICNSRTRTPSRPRKR